MRPKVHLFRWYKRTQLDIEWRPGKFRRWAGLHSPSGHVTGDCPCQRTGFLSLGLDRTNGWRPIAYWSPDATPVHPAARGLGVER